MRSPMQSAIAEAIRQAQTTGGRQSWRVRDIVSGKIEPCATLEMVIDERIAYGAEDRDVMAIGYEFLRQVRAKLAARKPIPVADIVRAYEMEELEQGTSTAAQMRALGNRGIASLRAAWQGLTGHREALDTAILATEIEIDRHERNEEQHQALRQMAITRLGR